MYFVLGRRIMQADTNLAKFEALVKGRCVKAIRGREHQTSELTQVSAGRFHAKEDEQTSIEQITLEQRVSQSTNNRGLKQT